MTFLLHLQKKHDELRLPSTPWTGEQKCKHFHTLKTKFALDDECFCHSRNLEAEADIKEI